MITEKRTRGQRGPDKIPRKFNPISGQNLKQNRINPELSRNIIENTDNATSLSSKLLYFALIFILIVIIGLIIWKIYREYITNRPK